MNEQQVVALVGADRCGKSEIAKTLSKVLDIPVFKSSDEHKTFLGDQRAFLNDLLYADPRMLDFLKQVKCSVILDRCWVCERVYAQYFNRETNRQMLTYLDKEYAKLGAKIVICTRKSFAGIKDDLNPNLDEVELRWISDMYLDWAKGSACKPKILYVDDEDLNREVKEILEFMGYDEDERDRLTCGMGEW